MGRPKTLDQKAKTDYKRQFNEDNYDRLYPTVPKGRKAEYQAAAAKAGISLNAFMQTAMDKLCREIIDTEDSEKDKT